jgi:hypothetical protein
MITTHRTRDGWTLTPGTYRPKPSRAARGFAPLEVAGFIVDEGGEVRAVCQDTDARPMVRTLIRHYWVPRVGA